MSDTKINLSDEQRKQIDQMVKPECGDQMGSPALVPPPNSLADGLVAWGNTLDFSSLPERAVVTIKVGSIDPEYGYKMQMSVIKQVLEPRRELLTQKKITILFMGKNDDIKHIPDEEMEAAGWFRKEKSLIISPYTK